MVWIFGRLEFVTLLPKPARVPHRRDRFLTRRSLLSLTPRWLPNSAHFACSSRVAIRLPCTLTSTFVVRRWALGVCCIASDADRHESVANPLTSTITRLLSERRLNYCWKLL